MEREPDGWFIALKDAKTGKESELLIMRNRKAAEAWRDKGYIIKPFIYLKDDQKEV